MTAPAIPRATARLQLHKGFTLDDAAAIVPYLARLGISHVYSSPLLTARAGSMHGYDIVDHTAINPELGGIDALIRLVIALRAHSMGLIMDIVPNHMGVGGADNAWWLDVLEWGRASPFADFFDIDWNPPDETLRGKILVPFLGAAYGDCLEAGEITLRVSDTGRLEAAYGEHVFPIAPRDYGLVLGNALAIPLFAGGRAGARSAAADMKADLTAAMATPDGKSAIETALARFDSTTEQGRASLHAILERQNYRLVWWRAAADEINWRRFFDITSLAGLSVERPEVFDATHVLILRLYAEGLVDGLRIDHVDGLADPRAYCRKLRRSLMALEPDRPADAPPGPAYIIVEKILAGTERLPADFATDGTTGYDFMDQVSALLHDPEGEAKLTEIWTELGHGRAAFDAEQRAARRLILRDALASELNTTAAAFHRIARRDLHTRDFTLTAIRRALTEVLVHFPVYRLYTGRVGRSDTDERVLDRALSGARRTMRSADRRLLDLIAGWLGGDSPRALPPGPERRERLRAMTRFQQLSSPVAAKSVEDTSFYRYGRLLSRNDVGSDPGQFALPVSAFHAACRQRQRHYPHALLATATHDHKRGEDVRARLAVLSEIPDEWDAQLRRWTRLNRPLRREIDGDPAPDPGDELMLYQTLVGAWMPGLAADDAEGVKALADRVAQWQEKALREAKRHTEWAAPEPDYETACREFLYQLLDPARPARLNEEIAAFAARIAPAGAVNGLAQTVLRLTTPGVPDLYQGTELWDGSLVDPDNRRPVDYGEREALLDSNPGPAALLASWETGHIKQSVIARILALRAAAPALFADGQYTALRVDGPASDHVLAFLRQHGHDAALIAVTRLPAKLLGASTQPLVPAHAWHGTRIALPHHLAGRKMAAILGCARPAAHRARLAVEDLFADLPVAVVRFE